jgi:hypothetical protein
MKTLIVVLLLLGINGCSLLTPTIKTVTVTKVVLPPVSMSRLYSVPKPIDKEVYIRLDPLTRERVNSLYIIELLRVIGKYRYQTKTLRRWEKEHENTDRPP